MVNIKTTIMTLLLILGISTAKAQDEKLSLSLEQAIDYAKEHNKRVQNANHSILAARYKKWETTTMGLPQINGEIKYQNWIEQAKQLLPAQIADPKAPAGEFVEIAFGTTQSMAANVTVSQLIFDGQYLVGLQAAKVFLEISENALQKTEVEIEKAVVNAYGNVLLTQEMIAITDKNIANVDKSLYETQKMFENGLTEEERVEQLEITKLNLKNARSNAKRLLDLSFDMLNFTLGRDLDAEISLTEKLNLLSEKNIDMKLIGLKPNLMSNIDVQIAQNQLRSKELIKRQEISKGMPQLSMFLSGAGNGFSNDFTFFNSDQRYIPSLLFGVNLKIPIFSSFRRTKAVQRAGVEIRKSQNDLDNKIQEIQLQYDRAQSNYRFAIENLQTSKRSLKLAERIEKKNQTKFKEGMGSSFDLSQAQQQLYTSQRSYLEAMLEVINSRAAIKSITNQ